MSFILDSSIALAWCFEDKRTPAVLRLLDRVAENGAVAPSHWPLEVLNGLLMAERRKRVDPARRLRMADFLRDLPVMIDPETSSQVWNVTARLAERFRLTIYDAAFLELAQRRNLPLGSLDQDLRAAATALGMAVLDV